MTKGVKKSETRATAIQKKTFTIKNSIPSENDAKITANSKAALQA